MWVQGWMLWVKWIAYHPLGHPNYSHPLQPFKFSPWPLHRHLLLTFHIFHLVCNRVGILSQLHCAYTMVESHGIMYFFLSCIVIQLQMFQNPMTHAHTNLHNVESFIKAQHDRYIWANIQREFGWWVQSKHVKISIHTWWAKNGNESYGA